MEAYNLNSVREYQPKNRDIIEEDIFSMSPEQVDRQGERRLEIDHSESETDGQILARCYARLDEMTQELNQFCARIDDEDDAEFWAELLNSTVAAKAITDVYEMALCLRRLEELFAYFMGDHPESYAA